MNTYDFCIALTQEAGAQLLKSRDREFEVQIKDHNPRDLVTNIDVELSTFISTKIKAAFPEHHIHSEEDPSDEMGEFTWTIDPIDGTNNFVRNIPHFSVCIGLLKNGVPELGAVYNPISKELFSFQKGEGAFLNGKPIQVSAVHDLAQAEALFSGGGRNTAMHAWGVHAYQVLLEKVGKRGLLGSSALDVCFVAAGRVEACIYGTMSVRDISPALGILIEAGGCSSDENGEALKFSAAPQKVYVANGTELLTELRSLIEQN